MSADLYRLSQDSDGDTGSHVTEADFFAMYISQSALPDHRHVAPAEINFTPSPQKYKHRANRANAFNDHNSMNGFSSSTFCHKDNLSDCLRFLDQELTSVGLQSLYDGDRHNVCHLVNNTYDLLQKSQRSARLREDLESQVHRQESDLAQLREAQDRLTQDLDKSRAELAQAAERERQTAAKHKAVAAKLKAEHDEVRRLTSVVTHRDAQYKHELKKREREMGKLRDRVHHMLSDRSRSKMGMEISAAVGRPDGKRATWSGKQEEEVYRQVISNYEDKIKELLVENSGLRHGLNDIQKEVITAVGGRTSEGGGDSEHSNDSSDSDGITSTATSQDDEGHFQMPYEYLDRNVISTLKEKCRQLRQHISHVEKRSMELEERRPSPSRPDQKQVIDKMQRELQRYKDIIEEQDQFIQQSLADGEWVGTTPFLDDGELLGDKEKLHVQKRLFDEQKESFDKERSNFTEATIRLHRDRKVFEEEKSAFLQRQFLQMTPFQKPSNNTLRVPVPMSVPRRVLPKTPRVPQTISQHAFKTPDCPRPVINTPSTRDLFRHLGLDGEAAKGAGLLDSVYRGRPDTATVQFQSPVWASSHRLRSSSAVIRTTPSGEHVMAASGHSADGGTDVSEHVDNIRMMLFSQELEDL